MVVCKVVTFQSIVLIDPLNLIDRAFPRRDVLIFDWREVGKLSSLRELVFQGLASFH